PALDHRILGLVAQLIGIGALQVREERHPAPVDAVVGDAEPMQCFDHLRPDLVVLLAIDGLVAGQQLHDERHAWHGASGYRTRSWATSAVQPVWWLAPSPAPVSPWKYSEKSGRSRQWGSVWSNELSPKTGRRP